MSALPGPPAEACPPDQAAPPAAERSLVLSPSLQARILAGAWLLALALSAQSLRWPMLYDDLHMIRRYEPAAIAAAFRGQADSDALETAGVRPFNILFNHARYLLFGESVVAHRLFLAALLAVYGTLLVVIAVRLGLPLPAALAGAALALCARYTVYYYTWLIDGHHLVQGILVELALLALLGGLAGRRSLSLAASVLLFTSALLIREDTLALVPVLVTLGLASLGAGRGRDRRLWLYASALAMVGAALMLYRARVVPRAIPPGHDVLGFLTSVRRMLMPMGPEPFDAASTLIIAVWTVVLPLLVLALILGGGVRQVRGAFLWLACAVMACSPALTLRRDDLLLFPVSFAALFSAAALREVGRRGPLLRALAVAVMALGILGSAYVSHVFAQNFHPFSARAVWWNGKFIYGSYSHATIPEERRRAIGRQLGTLGIHSERQLKLRLRAMVKEAIAQGRRRPQGDEVVFFPLLPEEDF